MQKLLATGRVRWFPSSNYRGEGRFVELVAGSRKEPGSVRFDIFQQGNRPNHFSVVEIWKDQTAYEAHITAAHTKAFRDALTPMTGALYDERLYRAL